MHTSSNLKRCGYVAIVGRPNVGKSTLMNHLIGQKISITSDKPQTTRQRILGIKTTDDAQYIYVDTPGVHTATKRHINRMMNKAALTALTDVDVIGFVVEACQWTPEDLIVLEKIKETTTPVVLLINKIDKLTDKAHLLPYIEKIQALGKFQAIMPVSALKGDNLVQFESFVSSLFSESFPIFSDEEITDKSMRFLATEIIREKLMRKLGQELPYSVAVEMEEYKTTPRITNISACIWVERSSQKGIVIGKQGKKLKEIGTEARIDIEKLIGEKVNLKLWVKIKEGWSENERILRSLGLDER